MRGETFEAFGLRPLLKGLAFPLVDREDSPLVAGAGLPV
jgi:hypothetical protein